MKKLILLLLLIIFSSNAFSFKLKDENLDGFWTVNSPLMLKENPDNKELNGPLSDFFKRMYGSIVFYIKGNNGIYFIGGESKKDEIIITKKEKDEICFKLNYKKSPEFCKYSDGPELWLFLETKSDTIFIPFKRDYDSDLNVVKEKLTEVDPRLFLKVIKYMGAKSNQVDCIAKNLSLYTKSLIMSKYEKLESLRNGKSRYFQSDLEEGFGKEILEEVYQRINEESGMCK